MRSRKTFLLSAFVLASSLAIANAQARLYDFNGDAPTDELGFTVGSVGDTNGDGMPELLAGSYKNDSAGSDAGMARMYSGATGATLFTWPGDAAGDWFGHSVAGIGDANSDGVPDVVVGARGASPLGMTAAGIVRVFSGATGATLWTRNGDAAGDSLGFCVDGAGDVNLDGYGDVIAGAPFADFNGSYSGRVRVMTSNPSSIVTNIYVIDGGAADDFFGWAVAGAGDINGDGFADFVVGAPYVNGIVLGAVDRGLARAYSGRTGAILWSWYGDADGDELGFSVSGAGDVDADGYADVIAGARYGGTGGLGMCRVYSGRTGAVLWSASADAGWGYFGYSVSDVGDFNGDLALDVVASGYYGGAFGHGVARVYSGSTGAVLHTFDGGDVPSYEFGHFVSGAGDLNGDGRGDLIVGARSGIFGAYQGSAHVFLGDVALASYCTAKVNSLGCTPEIYGTGAASVSIGNNFHVRARNVLNRKSGLMFWGIAPSASPFGGGTKCVASPVVRTPIQDSGGSALPFADCSGAYDFHFSQSYIASKGLTPGTLLYAQYWSRDPGFTPPGNIGLTDGLTFEICP